MSWSWLYDRRDQLDGYKAFAEIAYRLRPKVLPEDRDDVEMDIILKLKEVSARHSGNGDLTALLWHCARAKIADYWKRKDRERKRYSRIFSGDKGEMVSDTWEYVSSNPDIGDEMDTAAVLKTLPERLVNVGVKLVNGERLNVADKSYLSRQRAKLLEDYNYHVGDTEAERIRRLWEQGLSRRKIARILGRSSTTVTKYIKKSGLS